jgi:EmrB/QacA subfamily drug resistance transporter
MVASAPARPSNPAWVVALTSIAFFMVSLDILVVVTALPAMHRDLGASLTTLQWTVSAFVLAYAASITTAAALGDRYGRRRLFALGLLVFAAASAACALSPSSAVLIGARVVQGIGAGVIMPLSLTILTSAFPPERRGAIVGIWGGIGGIAVALGSLVGGAITQGLDWHWIFWVNVPIGLISAALVPMLLPESFGPSTRLDPLAVVLVSGGAVGIVLGLVRASGLGWASTDTLVTLGAGLALIACFVAWENRAPEPMLPMRLFRNATFSAANSTAFFMTGSLTASAFLVAQYFQLGLGYSPLEAGIRIMPWTAPPLFISPIAGALSDRIGRRPLMVVGMLLVAGGFAWVASIATPGVAYARMVLPLIIVGIGFSTVFPVAPTAALSAVAPQDIGKASGVNSTLQRFGSAFGVAVAAAAFATSGSLATPGAFVSGFRPALTVIVGLSLLGALTAFGVGRPRTLATAPTLKEPVNSP